MVDRATFPGAGGGGGPLPPLIVLGRDLRARGLPVGTGRILTFVRAVAALGFTDRDVAKPGSDKLIDAVVAHGSPDDIAKRLNEHIANGADHVAIQVLGGWDKLLPTLAELAGPLGLTNKD